MPDAWVMLGYDPVCSITCEGQCWFGHGPWYVPRGFANVWCFIDCLNSCWKCFHFCFNVWQFLKGIFGNCVKPVRIFRWWQAPHLEIPESQVPFKATERCHGSRLMISWFCTGHTTYEWWYSWYLMSLFPHAVCSYSRAWLHSNWHTSHTLTSWAGFPTLQVNLSLRWEIWSILEEGAAARFTTAWRQAVTSLNLSQALRLLCTSRKSWKTCQKETQAILRQFSPERQSNFLWSFIEVITMKWFVVFCINPCSAARKRPGGSIVLLQNLLWNLWWFPMVFQVS